MSAEIYRAEGRDNPDRFAAALKYAEEAQSVQPDSLLGFAAEAEYLESQSRFAEAVAVRTRYEPLCIAPNEKIELYQYRWRDHYWLRNFDEAAADLERIAKLVPTTDPMQPWFAHAFVALIEAERGDLSASRQRIGEIKDLKSPRRVLTAASFLRLLNSPAEADALLARERANIDWSLEPIEGAADDWWKHVYSLADGSRSLNDIKMLLPPNADSSLLAPAYFVDACRCHARGDRTAALENWRACEATYDYQDFSYLARVVLGRMEADPNWPAWSPQMRPGD